MAREFDYYIFIDYSENFIGYDIIEDKKIPKILPFLRKFKHYKDTKNRKLYLKNINTTIIKNRIKDYFFKIKIKTVRSTPEIYSDIIKFISKYKNCIIFISVDDRQFKNFKRIVNIINKEKTVVKKESELKKGSTEYMVSLVLDNLLNIERRKNMK